MFGHEERERERERDERREGGQARERLNGTRDQTKPAELAWSARLRDTMIAVVAHWQLAGPPGMKPASALGCRPDRRRLWRRREGEMWREAKWPAETAKGLSSG